MKNMIILICDMDSYIDITVKCKLKYKYILKEKNRYSKFEEKQI